MSHSEIFPSSLKIDKIIHRIEEGDIKIPAFQRGFVWKQGQVINLLDSIYNNYPIGSILLWNSNERLKSTRNIGGFKLPEREPEYPVNYVLDGQQRLSTIYAVFCKDRIEFDDNDAYKADTSIFEIFFDLNNKIFISKEDLIEGNTAFNINHLLEVGSFLEEIKNYNNGDQKAAQNLLSIFTNYEIPIVTTTKRKKEEVGTIFERINNTGTSLTVLDLMIAWTWSDDFHLKEKINDIIEILDKKGFGDTPEKIILQCLSGIIKKSSKTKDILSLGKKSVMNNIKLLSESLEKAIDFLSTEFNIVSRDFLPHSHQIVPLTYFFSKTNTPSNDQSNILKQWFWKTSFSRRYSGSTDMKMNEDILFFEKVVKNDFSGVENYNYSIDENNILDQKFSKSNPYTRAFLLLLAQNNPLNLVNGNKVDIGTSLSKYNYREYHHIFPRNHLKSKSYKTEEINTLCNYCFLPAYSNKIISDRSPSDYIFNIVPSEKLNTILQSNLMSENTNVYKQNRYKIFLKHRAKLILEYLNKTINNKK